MYRVPVLRDFYCFWKYLTRPSWDNRRHNWLRIWPIIGVPMPMGRYDDYFQCRRCGHIEAFDTLHCDSIEEQEDFIASSA